MFKVRAALILSFIFILLFTAVTACKEAEDNTSEDEGSWDAPTTGTIVGSETLPPDETETKPITQLDRIIRDIPDTLVHKGYCIYLEFGARGTLTIDNFNRLVLAEQLGLDTSIYTLVIESNVLEALKQDEAYGGIGYGQEWSGRIPVAIRNTATGETSDVYELSFILYKTENANFELATDVKN